MSKAQAFAQSLLGRGLILLIMIMNAAVVVLLIRYTRISSGPMYFSTTAVVMSEFQKLVVTTLVLFWWDYSGNLKDLLQGFKTHVFSDVKETLKMAVPSVVYALQNNLSYIALSNLDAATFQVTYQFKIVTTAVLMFYMMRKDLSTRQWIAIFVLTTGVALVNLEKADSSKPATGVTAAPVETHYNYPVGISAIALACFCSGFAGVYFEKLLKGSGAKSEASLWMKNFQMYFFCTIVAIVLSLVKDGPGIVEKGFFFGYNHVVYFLVCFQMLGGLLISLVMKYTDNIVKNFGSAAAILLATVGSHLIFGTEIGSFFALGTMLVAGSSFLYNMSPPAPSPPKPKIEGV